MPSHFPDDENGDVLRRMERDGDDLNASRDIDFSVAFPTEEQAEEFAGRLRGLEVRTAVNKSDCVPDSPWDVTVTKHMIPTHAGITNFDEELKALAVPLGGRNDGWGCFSQPVRH